jgi:Right handed beta helix region
MTCVATKLPTKKPGNHDATGLLTAAIEFVKKSKGTYTRITGEPGEYYFRANDQPGCYVYVDKVTGLSIDFPGSTFIFKQPGISAIQFDACTNCALTGVAIDYEILPFTQLNVLRIDGDHVIVEPMEGYPNLDQLHKVHNTAHTEYVVFDIRQTAIQYAIGGTKLPPSVWPIAQADRVPLGSLAAAFQPGDIMIVTARGNNPAINVENNTGLAIRDVTIYTSGAVGLDLNSSTGAIIERVTIAPKPGTTRRVSVVAGGIALNLLGADNTVLNCAISYACDDSIAGQANPSTYQPGEKLNLTVSGNRITNSFLARGIGFTSVVGANITQNTIIGTQQAGIMLGGAASTVGPANQPVAYVLITGNTLKDTNLGPVGVGADMLGAIEVMYYTNDAVGYPPHGQTYNAEVYVTNNTIYTTSRAGLWIGNVTTGAAQDNAFYDWGRTPWSPGPGDHVPNAVRPCAPALFQQETVGWFNRQFVGVVPVAPACLGS